MYLESGERKIAKNFIDMKNTDRDFVVIIMD